MSKLIILAILFFQLLDSGAVTVTSTIYMNPGALDGPNGPIPALAFNDGPMFQPSNSILKIGAGDTLLLTIWNMDSVAHDFAVKYTAIQEAGILPGSSAVAMITISTPGAYVYHASDGWSAYLGMAGLLQVGFDAPNSFYWNIHEHQTEWNDSLAQGLEPVSDFLPDHFTINGFDFPGSQNDSLSLITGHVGDTINVFIVNTGLMAHSIHSHGFHGSIISSSKYPTHIGRSKDSFPVLPFETLILQFVPHQPGLYPIHDHNLVAVTSGGNYPGGMLSRFNILP